MSRRRLEKQIAAYRDGALAGRAAETVRRQLDSDPEARLELSRTEALGRLTRDAWREGPPAPSPELLIARLRPRLARIDAELEAARPARWRSWFAPVPLAALGAVAAALVITVLLPELGSRSIEPALPQVVARAESAPATVAAPAPVTANEPADEIPVYDLAQGNSPLMLFEDGGTTFIWLLEPDETADDLSSLPGTRGDWV
jgi:hypothetical protein